MEAQGCARHRWVKPRGRKERERVSQSAPRAAGLVNWGRNRAARYRLSVIGDQRSEGGPPRRVAELVFLGDSG